MDAYKKAYAVISSIVDGENNEVYLEGLYRHKDHAIIEARKAFEDNTKDVLEDICDREEYDDWIEKECKSGDGCYSYVYPDGTEVSVQVKYSLIE